MGESLKEHVVSPEAWVNAHLALDAEMVGPKPAPAAMAAAAFIYGMSLDGEEREAYRMFLAEAWDALEPAEGEVVDG
jgi:hypothetical protein